MLRKVVFLIATVILTIDTLFAQTTYLPLHSEDYHNLDKLETRSGRLSDSLFLSTKPAMRSRMVYFLQQQRSDNNNNNSLSNIDKYNIDQMISENGEWTADENGAIDSKHPFLNNIYKKQYDFVHIKTDNFFLVANPVISAEVYSEKDNNRSLYWSARGFEARGWIVKKIGFYTYVADNQEKDVSFADAWVRNHNAVPGANYYQGKETGSYDYFTAIGYFDFAIVKDHLNATFGYDKHFIGDGLTSMFLSDFSGSVPFLKLNTRIWKLNYQNLYMELTPQFEGSVDHLKPHKYVSMHHLSLNATKWLNIGVFESIVFDREDRYEFRYLNPIIFLGEAEQSLGSPDKKHIGLDFKVLAAHHVQLYGQFLLDEFKAKEFFSNKGWWGNKWGLQLGAKYFDAFTLKNLDLQLEVNAVRPYTYTHYDSIANYTHYNQPLAHPLGADFVQLIGVARYQATKKLVVTAKGMYYTQGADTGATNYGSNIFESYLDRSSEYGVKLINGVKTHCMIMNINASYQLWRNFFVDLGATRRSYTADDAAISNATTTYFYGGIRLNIARRDFDFY